jgi:hypothetical protein
LNLSGEGAATGRSDIPAGAASESANLPRRSSALAGVESESQRPETVRVSVLSAVGSEPNIATRSDFLFHAPKIRPDEPIESFRRDSERAQLERSAHWVGELLFHSGREIDGLNAVFPELYLRAFAELATNARSINASASEPSILKQ